MLTQAQQDYLRYRYPGVYVTQRHDGTWIWTDIQLFNQLQIGGSGPDPEIPLDSARLGAQLVNVQYGSPAYMLTVDGEVRNGIAVDDGGNEVIQRGANSGSDRLGRTLDQVATGLVAIGYLWGGAYAAGVVGSDGGIAAGSGAGAGAEAGAGAGSGASAAGLEGGVDSSALISSGGGEVAAGGATSAGTSSSLIAGAKSLAGDAAKSVVASELKKAAGSSSAKSSTTQTNVRATGGPDDFTSASSPFVVNTASGAKSIFEIIGEFIYNVFNQGFAA